MMPSSQEGQVRFVQCESFVALIPRESSAYRPGLEHQLAKPRTRSGERRENSNDKECSPEGS